MKARAAASGTSRSFNAVSLRTIRSPRGVSQTRSLVKDVARMAIEPGTTADMTTFTPSRPVNDTHATSSSCFARPGLVVYGSTFSFLARARRSWSYPSAARAAAPPPPPLDGTEEAAESSGKDLHRLFRVRHDVDGRLDGLLGGVAGGGEEELAVADTLEVLDRRQLGDPHREHLE